jgi:hypothetical protein
MIAIRPIRLALLAGLAALSAGSLSCGLFETRDPAEPEVPSQDCRPLTSSAAATLNVEDSYGRASLRTCYESMLDTAFLFHPDPQDSLQNPPLFAGWDEQVEAGHNSQIATLQTFIEVDFTGEYQPAIISPDQNTEVRFYEYVLRVAGLVPSVPDTARYTGLADITFRRGTDGQWRMVDWADHRGSVSDSTWGLLRSNHRTGL